MRDRALHDACDGGRTRAPVQSKLPKPSSCGASKHLDATRLGVEEATNLVLTSSSSEKYLPPNAQSSSVTETISTWLRESRTTTCSSSLNPANPSGLQFDVSGDGGHGTRCPPPVPIAHRHRPHEDQLTRPVEGAPTGFRIDESEFARCGLRGIGHRPLKVRHGPFRPLDDSALLVADLPALDPRSSDPQTSTSTGTTPRDSASADAQGPTTCQIFLATWVHPARAPSGPWPRPLPPRGRGPGAFKNDRRRAATSRWPTRRRHARRRTPDGRAQGQPSKATWGSPASSSTSSRATTGWFAVATDNFGRARASKAPTKSPAPAITNAAR